MTYYHGGRAGLEAGATLVPAPAHVVDDCPICVARRNGYPCTVGAYRRWLQQFGAKAAPILAQLAGANDRDIMDPPSKVEAVYITTHLGYATWYAARSQGDLYQVEPIGRVTPSPEDHFPSWTVEAARVLRVVRRQVVLTRAERRQILHAWRKADRRHDRARERLGATS